MLSKSFTASIFLLALTSSVTAQCVIAPALGASNPGASDVQHPSDGAPCGNIPIAQNLDSSTPVVADGNGQFSPKITNFGTGADGSRMIKTAKVDPSGTGSNFLDCQLVANGDQDPTSLGTQALSVKLPNDTKCTGGSNKNRCLVSFVTDGGYGNCIVVTQTGNNVKRSTSEDPDKGKAKPAPAKAEPTVTTPPKGHRFRKGKKVGGRKTKETRGDTC